MQKTDFFQAWPQSALIMRRVVRELSRVLPKPVAIDIVTDIRNDFEAGQGFFGRAVTSMQRRVEFVTRCAQAMLRVFDYKYAINEETNTCLERRGGYAGGQLNDNALTGLVLVRILPAATQREFAAAPEGFEITWALNTARQIDPELFAEIFTRMEQAEEEESASSEPDAGSEAASRNPTQDLETKTAGSDRSQKTSAHPTAVNACLAAA